MSDPNHSMTPEQAAKAFFGQDEAGFQRDLAIFANHDPRLRAAFENTRQRYIENADS